MNKTLWGLAVALSVGCADASSPGEQAPVSPPPDGPAPTMGTSDLGPMDMGPDHGNTPATTAGSGAAPDGPVDAGSATATATSTADGEASTPDAGVAPELPAPSYAVCGLPEQSPISEIEGAWTGTLRLEQTLNGQDKSTNVATDLFLDHRGAPRRTLAATGYLGDGWQAFSDDFTGGEFSLMPLFTAGGNGTAWGGNDFEADGPANELTIENACIEATERYFAWRFDVTYRIADVVDRELYGYAEPDAPLVTLAAEELYAMEGTILYLRALAEGMTPDGAPVRIAMTGELQRLTR